MLSFCSLSPSCPSFCLSLPHMTSLDLGFLSEDGDCDILKWSLSQVYCSTPVILALERLWQRIKFEASLGYVVKSCFLTTFPQQKC